jgi:hypothetical protein
MNIRTSLDHTFKKKEWWRNLFIVRKDLNGVTNGGSAVCLYSIHWIE